MTFDEWFASKVPNATRHDEPMRLAMLAGWCAAKEQAEEIARTMFANDDCELEYAGQEIADKIKAMG